jgi:predicted secreted protein
MKALQLQKNKIYTDITDKKTPLKFTGKLSGLKNHGFNVYGFYVKFEPIKTEINKNWFDPKVRIKFFEEEIGNSTIIKFN